MLEKININKNIFLVNLVFGEVYCNLNCSYCSYPKESVKNLNISDLNIVKENISLLKKIVTERFPFCKIISITGGEPLLYPNILKIIAETFSDYSVRISTNGTLLSSTIIKLAKRYDNMYFAISLDGDTSSSNIFRTDSSLVLKNILKNIDTLEKNYIPVEVLTTLHRKNIDEFFVFLKNSNARYSKAIKENRFWLLASSVVDHNKSKSSDKFCPSKKQLSKFKKLLKENMELDLIKNIYPYYAELGKYYSYSQKRNICSMFDWALHLKFLSDSLWTDGYFLLYGCGCRGLKVLGRFNLKSKFDAEEVMERTQSPILRDFFTNKSYICKNDCFNNWQFYDLLIKNPSLKKKISILK